MTASNTFGECLNSILSTLDISISRLSKAINVDNSLVSRWIHGSRIPGYNTDHIENISEYLSKNVHNTFQETRLNQFFFSAHKNFELEANVKEKIKKVLLEAQGYSIESKKEKQVEKKKRNNDKEHISKFIFCEKLKLKEKNDSNEGKPTWNSNNITKSVELSSEDKIIFGIENVIAASIDLLETTAKKSCSDISNTIYITYYQTIGSSEYHALINLREALLKAINNGWNLVLILKMDGDINKLMEFIHFSKPLFETGKFYPYYIKKYGKAILSTELLVVPSIGAVSCFSTNICSTVDSAFYFKSKAAVGTVIDCYNVILTNEASPLITYYSAQNSIDYGLCLTECEENIGDRFLYKYSFSILTMPEHLYKKLLKRKKFSKDEMLMELEIYRRRLNAFLSNVQIYEYKDIYMEDSIRMLIKNRQFYYYNYSGVEVMDLEAEDIIEYLENVIYLLKNYNNYNIAFISRGDVKNHNLNCVVKDRKAVLFECYEPSKNIAKVQLSIEEPTIVKAFNRYFEEIWKHIAPVNNDKSEIIEWLQSQINVLKKMVS